MARYFDIFPKTFYSANNDNNGLDTVTNIISRFAFEEKLKENTSIFYRYDIQDGDTPEIIARKYYDNSERHWIVLLYNNIIDPQFDWPLDDRTLLKFVDEKYTANGAANTTPVSGIRWAQNSLHIHSYYKVITTTTSEQTTINKLQVDANTYANVVVSTSSFTLQDNTTITQAVTKETKTYYEYELEENEKKRQIKLLKPEFVPAVEKEFKKVFSK